jgi:hypothetical protein
VTRRLALAKKSGLLGEYSRRYAIFIALIDCSFETREIAEKVLAEFHNVVAEDGVKLLLRFADTKAQKILKQQSNERRAYRAGEYNYSVEVVQGSTPSPSLHRLQQTVSHISPASQVSYVSPVGVGSSWTPATSISPS